MPRVRPSNAAPRRRCSDISTAYDRIIYDIYDDRVTVLVVQAEEHYNDK
jgi:Txe/YoeB family toxin of Txe-Axe toxin-antitoxin module